MKIFFKVSLVLVVALLTVSFSHTVNAISNALSENVTLTPGWNIVSTPRVLESHSFSAAEKSSNFDIYVLDPSSPSGWSTMAGLSQSEFTPLYGYFINNKTGSDQTLIFNYKDNTDPNERLFDRSFTKTGWYSIGPANPTYAKNKCSSVSNTGNVGDVLYSLSGQYSFVVDFTDGDFSVNPNSVSVGSIWKAVIPSDVNQLNDIRELKGYAVYIGQANSSYTGFQNNDSISACPVGQLSANINGGIGTQTYVAGVTQAKIGSFSLSASSYEGINLSSLQITTGSLTGTDNGHIYLQNMNVKIGSNSLNLQQDTVTSSTAYIYTPSTPVIIPEGGSITVDVYADILSSSDIDLYVPVITLSGATATGVASNSDITFAESVDGQEVVLSGPGTLTVSADTTTPSAHQIVLGTVGDTLGQFRFSADNNEGIKITDLKFTETDMSGSGPATFGNLTLWDGSQQIGTGTALIGTSPTFTSIFHFATPPVVPSNSTKTLVLKGDVSSYSNSPLSDNQVYNFMIAATSTDVTAVGTASDSPAIVSFNGNVTANAQTTLRTKLSVASFVAIGTGYHSHSAADDVAYLTLAADNAYGAQLNSLKLTFSGAAPTSTPFTVTLRDASNNVLATSSVVSASTTLSLVSSPYIITGGTSAQFKITVDATNFNYGANNTPLSMSVQILNSGDLVWRSQGGSTDFNLENKVVPLTVNVSYQ